MTANNNRKRGKRNEKALAYRLGAKRVGILGNVDITDYGPFSIETKTLKAFAGRKIITQAIRNCPDNKTPLAIIHEPNQRRDNDIVMIRLSDWELWYGKLIVKGE